VLTGPATGELVHAGVLVAQGYWRQPAATAARFRPDPRGRPGTVVYSGDLVRRDAEGFHYFVGRADGMLKVAGHRISPDEITTALLGEAGVGELVAFGCGTTEQGDRIVLCVAGVQDDAGLRQRLLRWCRARLPAYMVPAHLHVVPALPHTPNGKIDVVRLRAEVAQCIAGS
jgi:acyl-coenzyme A synthetase/AMP-(fatty) acid ligase